MSFHVEAKRSYRRAWVFNLGEEELRRDLLAPWARGELLEIGDQEWDPAESTLTVLESRPLEPPELAHGQGWNNAMRIAEDVTSRLLGSAAPVELSTVALLIIDRAAEPDLSAQLEQLGLRVAEWSLVKPRILAGEPSGAVAAVVAVGPDTGSLSADESLELGIALGAFGKRAIIVATGGLKELAGRLRAAGCEPLDL